MSTVASGLEGIIATETNLSSVDGHHGELIIAGFPVEALARNATFEETVYLLWNGRLPDEQALRKFRATLAERRRLPDVTLDLLEEAATCEVDAMDALRMAAAILSLSSDGDTLYDAMRLVASFPSIVAAYWRLRNGESPIAPDPELGHAGNYLYMLTGDRPSDAQTRALETYLNTVVDHGLNASTFTARVIISTQSDMVSAVTGAVGALKGPLHGGAPGPALDMVFDIGEPANAEPYLRKKLERGERLMGFGHRVYKVRDPRADVLSNAAETLYHTDADLDLYRLAQTVERNAVELLEEYKPGRKLQTNVEFYTALLLHGVGIPNELFAATFAISRVGGWTAHCFEQLETGRLIRPQSAYTGEQNREWVPVARRNTNMVA